MSGSGVWKKCSVCKKDIAFGAKYYVCSVSTCNGKRTGYVFCGVPCFEAHLPGARHKEAFAYEEKAPFESSAAPSSSSSAPAPTRRIIKAPPAGGGSSTISTPKGNITRETLVVVSKLKDYVKARGDMNTSASCMSRLSDIIRYACDDAIDNARADGRKTLMDRDFKNRPK